ncbi:MAG: arginine--tRNA ligase [Planctomycetales bacterium]|nr:arginine--tRNA ligase [Planctomycetales bacterium]
MNLLTELKERFRPILADYADDPADLLAMIRPAQDAKFGDYQANMAMPLGKKVGRSPRDLAAEIVGRLQIADLCEPPEVAGPGFINLRIKEDWIKCQLEAARHDERLTVEPTSSPRTVIVDFSSPNVAKPMHVGHIRSTVIGDALCRTLRFAGHKVISDNHLGDWGTQFGMIIYGYRHFVDQAAYESNPIQELGRIYRQVRSIMDVLKNRRSLPQKQEKVTELEDQLTAQEANAPSDPAAAKKHAKDIKRLRGQLAEAQKELGEVAEKVKAAAENPTLSQQVAQHADIEEAVLRETAKLHEGDAENHALWEEFLPKCRTDIQKIYDRLNVTFDEELGESFYHDRLAAVVVSLEEKQMACESEGATCVFLDEFDAPMIVRKRDGAFLYATTDLATIQYRMDRWNPDAILYVVDFRQSEHFDKLFAVAKKWGFGDVELTHVKFGTVLGQDKRPFQTRAGDTVGLEGLLDEAERKAYEVVSTSDDGKPKGAELDEAQRRHIAQVVGIAALKYADLSQNRDSDYVFSYDKMLALNGNTATYMQYSYARAHGIFAKGDIDVDQLRDSAAAMTVDAEAERALAILLLRFNEAIDDTLTDYRPNTLTNYLFELAKAYSIFFEQCPVLKAESESLKHSRLLLCDLTARTLKTGLGLLGIDVVEKM